MKSNPMTEFVSSLSRNEKESLLSMLELSESVLCFENCRESELFAGLCLSLWKIIKAEEVGEK